MTHFPANPFDFSSIGSATSDGAGLDVLSLENEMDQLPHLAEDLRFETDGIERETIDTQTNRAAAHLARLPGPRQAIHMVNSGKYALWDMVPAALKLAKGKHVNDLWIATLGFSKLNVASMAELLDAGQVKRIHLLCSHYFKGTSNGAYELAAAELGKRKQFLLSIRTHAKILAMELSDGSTLTIEASANLRSCKNIEQLTAYGDRGIYNFHVRWIDSLFRLSNHERKRN